MSEDITEIDIKDVKKPKKLVKKLAKIGLLGLGAVAQEFVDVKLSEMTGANKALLSGGEILVSGIAAGSVKNKYAKSFLSGILAGASKDLVSNIITVVKEGDWLAKLKGKYGAPPADEGAPPPTNNAGDSCYV